MLWELLTRKELFEEVDDWDTLIDVVCKQNQRPVIPPGTDPGYIIKIIMTTIMIFSVIKTKIRGSRILMNFFFDRLKALIEDCWSADETARPSFSTIVKRIDTILIDIAVVDVQANIFWKKYFPTRVRDRINTSLLGKYLSAFHEIRTKCRGKISLTSSVAS